MNRPAPVFFPTPAQFRARLAKHQRGATELLVGFRKVDSGRPGITWPPLTAARILLEQDMKRVTKRTGPAQPAKRPKRGAAAPVSPAEGDAQVRAYLRKLPPWQRAIAQRFDDLLAKQVDDLRRCIKWGMPFYGVAGRGWFVSCGGFPKCVKVTFFQGTKLKPVPPVGTSRQTRSLDVTTPAGLAAAPMVSWVRQAVALPGFAS